MNYAIEFVCEHFPHLHSTARKRALKHSLMRVTDGLALIKVGKLEYALEPNQFFWIPQGCLCAITYLPNTKTERVDFSIRLLEPFPHQAGFAKPTSLLSTLLDSLTLAEDHQEQIELLTVVKRQSTRLKPKLIETSLSKAASHWQPSSTKLDQPLHLALLLRDAQKRRLSGMSKQQIVDELFAGQSAHCDKLAQVILGNTL